LKNKKIKKIDQELRSKYANNRGLSKEQRMSIKRTNMYGMEFGNLGVNNMDQ
jgi:hypothetical protein